MKYVALAFFSLLSLASFAESSYTYKEEYTSFVNSSLFPLYNDVFAGLIKEEARCSEEEGKAISTTLQSLGFVIVAEETLPALSASIQQIATHYALQNEPAVIIMSLENEHGRAIAASFANNCILIDQAFLLSVSDSEINSYIEQECKKLAQTNSQEQAKATV